MHRWHQSYLWKLLWTARSNLRMCTQGKVYVLHDSLWHCKALVNREISPEIRLTVKVFMKIINFIKKWPLKSRIFEKLCAEMNAEH